VKYNSKFAWFVIAGVILWTLPLSAQLELGQYRLNMNANLYTGYNGSFGSNIPSGHNLGLGGESNIFSSYFNPNFLSFTAHPYYNRSQSNSAFQSIDNSSGIDTSVTIFGGSHFPGFASFSKSTNGTSQYGIPGTTGLVSHGNQNEIGVGWSAYVQGYPSLSAVFTTNSDNSTVYGTTESNKSSTSNFTLQSSYRIAGFQLLGGYLHVANDMTAPSFIDGNGQHSNGSTNSYQVTATHSFPLSGSFSAGFTRTSYDYNFVTTSGNNATTTSGSSADTLTALLAIHPIGKVGIAFNATYSDNLAGSIGQALVTAGGAPPQYAYGGGSTHSFLVGSNAYIGVLPSLSLTFGVTHLQQYFGGSSYGSTQVTANANFNYARPLLGVLTFSLGMHDNANQDGNTGLGLNSSVNFSRKIRGFDLSASFMYSQYVQTILGVNTGSSYSYSASAQHKIKSRLYWTSSFGGGHSGFGMNGASNHSERFSNSVSYRGYAANVFYSQSAGLSLLTATGLVSVPTNLPPGMLPPEAIALFDARSLGVGLSATILRSLTITASYSNGRSSTQSPQANTKSNTEMSTALLRYPVRKLYITAGYTRFRQGISTVTNPTGVVSSYSFGISRWFNVF